MKTENMLEFAYKMRDIYEESVLKKEYRYNSRQVEDMRSAYKKGSLYSIPIDDYKDILRMIYDLENEIAYDTAKAIGRSKENERTKSAKKFLKIVKYNDVFTGYKETDNGKIVLCNGYGLFVGDKIIGVPKSPRPDQFNLAILNNFDDERLTNEMVLTADDVAGIKARLTEGRAKTGKRKAKDMIEIHCDDALVFWKGANGVVAFNADYILWAIGLVGGDSWSVKFGDRNNGCIIEGKNGKCFTLPVKIGRDENPRVDKEVR